MSSQIEYNQMPREPAPAVLSEQKISSQQPVCSLPSAISILTMSVLVFPSSLVIVGPESADDDGSISEPARWRRWRSKLKKNPTQSLPFFDIPTLSVILVELEKSEIERWKTRLGFFFSSTTRSKAHNWLTCYALLGRLSAAVSAPASVATNAASAAAAAVKSYRNVTRRRHFWVSFPSRHTQKMVNAVDVTFCIDRISFRDGGCIVDRPRSRLLSLGIRERRRLRNSRARVRYQMGGS
ncbi:hypothetical protein CPAR01_09023 [Colletotrichum paranaense]|uniref:Uncharacterized protein n=1 Tax=Colletotrichum paranaense TaxID=1914294 RepID=A0ABQ9SFJ3_9PEZI|nr:uncharacterized protein CPAR01_09023 [Colletotrichum paranaense]KAK1535481.1 hypothetical protein CPAR01_09023 [Colletotrichum paranaense]